MGVIVNVFQYVKVLSWWTFHMWTRPGYGSFLTLACLMDIDMSGIVLLPKSADFWLRWYGTHCNLCRDEKNHSLVMKFHFCLILIINRINVLFCVLFVEWLKYCRDGVKHQIIKQLINPSVSVGIKCLSSYCFPRLCCHFYLFIYLFIYLLWFVLNSISTGHLLTDQWQQDSVPLEMSIWSANTIT